MAPAKRQSSSSKSKFSSSSSSSTTPSIPQPFKSAPDVITRQLTPHLSTDHVYVVHVDRHPVDFKRKIFLVPVAMNIVIAILLALRLYAVLPYYLALLLTTIRQSHPALPVIESLPDGAPWSDMTWLIGRRAFTFMLDFLLIIFVWPWPFEFAFGRRHGNPVAWRLTVGFREEEIYVRRSREWTGALGGDPVLSPQPRSILLAVLREATSTLLTQQKTGYLTMNGQWDLDWATMVRATRLVDDKHIALDAFRCLVLVHHKELGWLTVDMGAGESARDEDRRRHVFAFRDALRAVDKEDLFYRWIEIVQFEASRPEGFGPEKQAEVAQKIRDIFQKEGINFDEFWEESVGSAASLGI